MDGKKNILYPFWSAAIVISILASVFCLGFASCDHGGKDKGSDTPTYNSAKADKDADKGTDRDAGADPDGDKPDSDQ